MHYKKTTTILLSLCIFTVGRGQELLSRPHVVSRGDVDAVANLGADVFGGKDYLGISLYAHIVGDMAKKSHVYLDLSESGSYDTLTLSTDAWKNKSFEMGFGKIGSRGHVFWQNNIVLGYDYFRYRYYNTTLQRDDFRYNKALAACQYSLGYQNNLIEAGIIVKLLGYINIDSRKPGPNLNDRTTQNYLRFNLEPSNLVFEPLLFASIKISDEACIRMTARTQMMRNEFNQFPISKSVHYSIGILGFF
jgi:hypothetical protein